MSYQKASVMQQYVHQQDQAHECNLVPADQAKSVFLVDEKTLTAGLIIVFTKCFIVIRSLLIALGNKLQHNLRLAG
jgi:hypothetical protein